MVLVKRKAVIVSCQLSAGPGFPAMSHVGVVHLQLELRPGLSSMLEEPLLSSQQRLELARDAGKMG